MLKRKLYIAGFVLTGIAVAAAASEKIPALIPSSSSSTTPVKKILHEFDSNGICTCIPASCKEDLAEVPRLQLNSSLAAFVKKYNGHNGHYLDLAKEKTKQYFDIVDSVLRLNDAPVELKYLAFIESGMSKNPVTRTGAIGPWALMPDAARRYGLKTGKNDERINFAKSTAAAARLLKDMYNEYGDWLLAVAAYNCGPGLMERAMKRAGTHDYWQLQGFLPAETQHHVMKFVAVHYHFEGHGSLVTLTRADLEKHTEAVAVYLAKRNEQPVADSMAVTSSK